MKKIYMNPTMKVVELKRRQHLLAGSLGNGDTPVTDLDDVIPGSGLDADAPSMSYDLFGM